MSIAPHSFDQAECRICFEDNSTQENPLISPCLCNGTSKYIHKDCIQRWRRTNIDNDAFYFCRECNYEYNIGDIVHPETYFIKNSDIEMLNNPKTAFIYFGFIIFSTLALLPLDKYTGFYSLYIITNFQKPSDDIFDFFKTNEIYILMYNFCSISLFIYLFFYIGFFIKINIFVKRKNIYWKKRALRYFLSTISSLHLYAFGLLCHNKLDLIESFLILELFASMTNIVIFTKVMIKHNQTLRNMNNHVDIGDIYDFSDI